MFWLVTVCLALGPGCTTTVDREVAAHVAIDALLSSGPEAAPAVSDTLRLGKAEDLASALRGVLLRDPRLVAASAEVAAARAELASARASSRPNVAGSGQVGSEAGSGDLGVGVALLAEQVLLDGGARSGEIDAGSAAVILAQADARQVENTVAFEALEAIVTLWRLDEQLRLSQAVMTRLGTLDEQVNRAVDVGLLDRDAQDRLLRTTLATQTNATRLAAERSAAAANFTRAFGYVPASVEFPAQLAVLDPKRRLDDHVATAPALRAAAAKVILAEANERRARAALAPQVALQAKATSPTDADESATVGVGLEVRYNFSDGGKRKAQVEAAAARTSAAVAQLRAAKDQMRIAVETANAQVEAAETVLELSEQTVSRVAEEKRLAGLRAASGTRDIAAQVELEVLGYSAAEQVIARRADLFLGRARLAATLGLLASALHSHRESDGSVGGSW